MKMFWKTEDSAIDKLLGAQRARQGDPAQICREFDPDLANAYIEHSLTTTETTRYEQHMSACAHCRKSVVALSRMAVADPVFSQTEVKSFALAGETRTGIKRWFGVMSAPQWAMAATAALVIAISLPFLISNKRESANLQATPGQSDSAVASNKPQHESDSLEAPASGRAAANTSTQPGSNAQAKIEREQESPDKNLLAIAKEPVAESPATGAGTETPAPAPQPPQPAEPKADSATADQTVAKAEQTPPASRPAEPQLPKIDPEVAKSLAKDKDSAQVSQLTTGVPGGEDINKKEATIREDSSSIPPPPKPSSSEARERSQAMTRGAVGRANLRDSNSEAARPASSIKVGGRKFFLRNDIWTDKDYNPNKEMPMVTIFRDSDVYREQFSRHPGMRPFLTGFAETARVIFIYKGTVYKLIPQ
jgi:hypothetical protein